MAYIPSECSLEEYEKVIYSGDAKNRLYVKHGDTIIGTNGDNNASPFASKLTVKRRILKNGSKTITLNNFISQEIDLVLHDYKIEDLSEEIEIKIGTFIDKVNDYVYVPLGKFLIQDNPTTDKDKTTYKLRDFSVKFDFYYNGKPLIDANGGSATKMQILQDICKQAGVVCKINSFTGYNEKIGIYDNSVTARAYIAYLAEQAGKMASINRYGELVFVDITSDDKTATGEKSIIINDALEKRINSFIIEGKSEQETRSGKNVAKISTYQQTEKYTYDKFEYNNISVTKTATGGVFFGAYSIDIKQTGTYTFSGNVNFSGNRISFYAYSDSLWGTSIGNYHLTKTGEFEFNLTFNSTGTFLIGLYGDEDIGTTYQIQNFMCRLSTITDKTYEQYGVSPSPDYPSEIETVKGIENLLNTPYTKENKLTKTATKNDDYVTTSYYAELEADKTYTFSCKTSGTLGGSGSQTQVYLLLNKEYTTFYEVVNKNGFKFKPTVSGKYYLRYDVNVSGETHSFWDFQIEEGSVAHPFVPYGRYLYNKITGKNIANFDTNTTIGNLQATGVLDTTNNNYITNEYIKVKPNTKYTLKLKNTYTTSSTNRRCIEYNSSKEFVKVGATISSSINEYKSITFTTSSTTEYIRLSKRITDEEVQLEENLIATKYEPYKEKIITYDLKKENLCNITSVKGYKYSNKLPSTETDVITIEETNNGFSYVITDNYYNMGLTNNIILKPNTTYLLSLFRTDNNVSSARNYIYNVGEDGSYTLNKEYNETGKVERTFTTDSLGVIALGLGAGGSSNGGSGVIENIKIYEGTETDDYYELASIGDIKDELDETTGVLTKRIGKAIFNGSENWSFTTNGNAYYISNWASSNNAKAPTDYDEKSNSLSNYFVNASRAEIYTISNGFGISNSGAFNIKNENYTSGVIDDFKTWLSNNPVTVYYVLATPETIQLEPTEISTFEGVNNITLMDNIDTNISVNYEGQKHIHNISPDIVESFTVGDKYKVSKLLFEAGANKFEDGTDDDDILYLNSDNPYINKQIQINNIFPHVKGFEINSFKTGKILGNPAVDPADLIKLEYNGIIYKTLAQYTLNFGGTMTSNYETTVEHEAKQSNVVNKGFATKKFVKAELDNIDAKFSVEVGEINDGLSDLETNVTNTANRVSDTESKLNDTNSNLENLIGRTTKLEQDNQSWTFEFNNIYEDLTALNNKTNETDKTTKEIKDYIKFVDGNIILEGTDSKCSVVISKEKISFYTDGNESAFISNNELYITDNTVLNKQTIGKWEIKPDSEGNLNTRWIG